MSGPRLVRRQSFSAGEVSPQTIFANIFPSSSPNSGNTAAAVNKALADGKIDKVSIKNFDEQGNTPLQVILANRNLNTQQQENEIVSIKYFYFII